MPPDPPSSSSMETAPLLQAVQRPATAAGGASSTSSSSAAAQQAEIWPSSDGPAVADEPAYLGTCRICFEPETAASQCAANPLISPCLCSGSSKYVHRQCLAQWRDTNHRADAYYQCEVCKYRYQYRRLWWAGLLGSRVAVLVLYGVLMASLIAALGFVPVTSLIPRGSSSSGSDGDKGGGGSSPPPGGSPAPTPLPPGSSPAPAPLPPAAPSGPQPLWLLLAVHLVNGLLMMGVLGLLLSAALGVARACGYTGLLFMPDAFCPTCLWCLDAQGGPGLGWAPFVQCTGAAAECGAALLVLAALAVLTAGAVAAAYMVYAGLWALVQRGLEAAQLMVENVQQEQQPAAQEQQRQAGAGGGDKA